MKVFTTTRYELTQEEVRTAIADWFNLRDEGPKVSAKDIWTEPSRENAPAAIITIKSD